MTQERLNRLAQQFLPLPVAQDSKYTRGVVGFVSGGVDYPGAALLGISAALSCPIGMVRYVGPVRVADLILIEHPEVVTTQSAETAGRCQTWVLGSGVSANDAAQVQNIKSVLAQNPVAVVDAGALEIANFAALGDAKLIVTPHHGEALRLLQRLTGTELQAPQSTQEAVALAHQLQAAVGQTVLLKGSTTVLTDGRSEPLLIGPNSAHLATAGSGDVLAGLLGAIGAGAMQSGTIDWIEVAEFAVLLHSYAAEVVAQHQTVTASAITKALPNLVRQLQEAQ